MVSQNGRRLDLDTPSGVQRWRVVYRPLKRYDGFCDYAKKVIELRGNMTRSELVNTIIHEACHAASGSGGPFVEAVIERIAHNATAILLNEKLIAGEDDG